MNMPEKSELFLSMIVILLSIPKVVYAHGEQIVLIIITHFIVLVIMIISLFLIKLHYSRKVILFIIYLLTTYFSFYLPYQWHLFILNPLPYCLYFASLPVVSIILTYIILKKFEL